MRKEIEVKARVTDSKKLFDQIKSLNITLSPEIIQNDETFVDQNFGDYDRVQSGKNILRIRKNNGKYIFTLKQPQKNELDCIEKETEIADPEEFRDALIIMGFKPAVKINKVRRKAKYLDYEICIDEVENLGTFIEVEKITDDSDDSDKVQEELFHFLESLGIDKKDQEFHGYDTLIYLNGKS
jgi:adenylate cyclase class 2